MQSSTQTDSKIGIVYAIAAYSTWGFVPLFWNQLKIFSPTHILAHRIIWSVIFFVFIFTLRRSIKDFITTLKNKTLIKRSIPSAVAIGLNWGLYIYAVNSGHALESSLGYFINPIFNVLIGAIVFHESLNKFQWTAFAFACLGVSALTIQNDRVPWIALALASTFSFYGVMRKKTAIKGVTGTAIESLLLVPVAIFIFSQQNLSSTNVLELNEPFIPALLLTLGGALTALPLVWFSEAAQRLPLSTLGFFQYISPTFQFLIAVFIFREPFDIGKLISFSLIWLGLLIFIFDTTRNHFQSRSEPSSAST